MTDRQSDFVEQLRERLDANDRQFEEAKHQFATAQALHAERRQAIKLLLEAEGYVVEDEKENDASHSAAPSGGVVHDGELLRHLRNRLAHYFQSSGRALGTTDATWWWDSPLQRAITVHHYAAVHGLTDDDVLSSAPQPNDFAAAWTKINEMDASETSTDQSKNVLLIASCQEWAPSAKAGSLLSMIHRTEGGRPSTHIEDPESATTRDFVRQALVQAGGPVRMVDVVEAVKKMGSSASADTVRSVLQKMLHSGEAERPDRGLYTYKPKSTPVRTLEDELALLTAAPQEVESNE